MKKINSLGRNALRELRAKRSKKVSIINNKTKHINNAITGVTYLERVAAADGIIVQEGISRLTTAILIMNSDCTKAVLPKLYKGPYGGKVGPIFGEVDAGHYFTDSADALANIGYLGAEKCADENSPKYIRVKWNCYSNTPIAFEGKLISLNAVLYSNDDTIFNKFVEQGSVYIMDMDTKTIINDDDAPEVADSFKEFVDEMV